MLRTESDLKENKVCIIKITKNNDNDLKHANIVWMKSK